MAKNTKSYSLLTNLSMSLLWGATIGFIVVGGLLLFMLGISIMQGGGIEVIENIKYPLILYLLFFQAVVFIGATHFITNLKRETGLVFLPWLFSLVTWSIFVGLKAKGVFNTILLSFCFGIGYPMICLWIESTLRSIKFKSNTKKKA